MKGQEIAPGFVQEALFDPVGGRHDAEQGQGRTIDASINAEWRRRAEQAMRTLMASTPRFSADDVAVMAGMPPSRNGMGALFGAYHRRRLIEPVGWTTGKRRDRHAGSQRVWSTKT